MNYGVPKFAGNVPFFMLDITNYQLITSLTVPGDISDTKDIVLGEIPIPGLNYQPVMPGGGGNRKISFDLMLIKRNNTIGNLFLLKQFDMLRNQAVSLLSFTPGQFAPYPQVLFYYGVGSIPLLYYVKKADMVHKAGMVNALGFPQVSTVSMELILNENSLLYKGEEIFRKVSAAVGMVMGLVDVIQSGVKKNQRMY